MKIIAKLSLDTPRSNSPYADVCEAIALLMLAVVRSNPNAPEFGGVLKGKDGQRVGSYLVSIEGEED